MSLAVAVFLRSPCQNKVLLIKRRDVPVYALPGGGVEKYETTIEAGIREMKEETGLDVSFKRIIGYYYPLNRLTKPTILLECEKIGGNETISDETAEVRYFSIQELPYLLPPPYADWIRDGFSQNPPLFKPISSVTYSKLILYFFQHPILIIRFLLARLNLPINTN